MTTELPSNSSTDAIPKNTNPLRSVLLSETVKSAAFFGFVGLGFSGAHLLLAKFLPVSVYGVIALSVAMLNFAKDFGPLGARGVILRHNLRPDRRMLIRVFFNSGLVGSAIAVVSVVLYDLDVVLSILLFVGAVVVGTTIVAATFLQSRQKFKPAMLLSQCGDLFLLAAAIAVVLHRTNEAWFTIAIIVLGYSLTSLFSWMSLLGSPNRANSNEAIYSWREALSYSLMTGALSLLLQFERFLIPQMLSFQDLATFGVLAAIVIAPYRMLQLGADFTVLPRLRAEESALIRRRLLAKEFLILTALIIVGSILLLWLTPIVLDFIYDGKFEISGELILAAIVLGVLKSYSGLAKATAVAVCTTKELGTLGLLLWLAVIAAMIGASFGSAWGLTGLVLGIATGWFLLLVFYAILTAKHLKL